MGMIQAYYFLILSQNMPLWTQRRTYWSAMCKYKEGLRIWPHPLLKSLYSVSENLQNVMRFKTESRFCVVN